MSEIFNGAQKLLADDSRFLNWNPWIEGTKKKIVDKGDTFIGFLA